MREKNCDSKEGRKKWWWLRTREIAARKADGFEK
jgi:hypothetical protein